MKHNRLFLTLLPFLLLVVSACDATDAWEEPIFFTSVNASVLNGTQVTAATGNITTAYITSLNMTGDVLPTSNNTRSLGATLFRWLTGWFVNLVSETHNTTQLTATTGNISTLNVGNQTLSQSGNQLKIGSQYVAIPTDTDIFFYRNHTDEIYYCINGTSGQIITFGTNATDVLQTGLSYVHVNTKVRAGGDSGGWYLNTLNISGRKYNDLGPGGAAGGLYETVIDLQNIEFVKTGSANEDFITIDSMLANVVKLGVITGSVSSNYSMVHVKPTTEFAYGSNKGFKYNDLSIVSITGAYNGTALFLDGLHDSANGSIDNNTIYVQEISSTGTGSVSLKLSVSGDGTVYGVQDNQISINYNAPGPDDYCVQLNGGAILTNWIRTHISVTGGAAGVWADAADNNIFELLVADADANETVVFTAAGVTNNTVIATGKLHNFGFTDSGTNNRLIFAGGVQSGTGNITNATTSAVITHGLIYTPSAQDIFITWTNNSTNDSGNWWLTSINSTAFTLNVRTDPGASGAQFSWRAGKY